MRDGIDGELKTEKYARTRWNLFYEFVLLILGAIMFIVLLILLFVLVKTGNEKKILLAFFLLSLLMIGFQGIQKIQSDIGAISL